MQNNDICINCGNNATHYHHVVPRALGGNDTTNKVPLCDKCHGLIHNIAFKNGEFSHSELTKIGMEKARKNGKQIGRAKDATFETKKSKIAKEQIKKYSKDFNGALTDMECIALIGINRKTYYKYKKEIKEREVEKNEE